MDSRRVVLMAVVGVAAAGCQKSAQPGSPDDFLPPVGEIVAPICTAANDGKHFTLEGWMGLPTVFNVDKKTDLGSVEFNPKGPGEGRSISVDVKLDDDISMETGKEKGAGYKRTKAEIVPGSFRVHTKSGDATDQDKLRVTLEVGVVKHFSTGAITACSYRFLSAEKL